MHELRQLLLFFIAAVLFWVLVVIFGQPRLQSRDLGHEKTFFGFLVTIFFTAACRFWYDHLRHSLFFLGFFPLLVLRDTRITTQVLPAACWCELPDEILEVLLVLQLATFGTTVMAPFSLFLAMEAMTTQTFTCRIPFSCPESPFRFEFEASNEQVFLENLAT